MKNISRKTDVDKNSYPVYAQPEGASGLADLQKTTHHTLRSNWGFTGTSQLKIKRYKLDQHTWLITVVNPKTQKTILQAEGHGDTVFANEDNLARMAETLMQQGLTIRTHFED